MPRKFAISLITLLAAFSATSLMACPSAVSNEKAEQVAKRFVTSRLAGPNGEILSRGKVRYFLGFPIYDDDALLESGYLSESAGLFLIYAAIAQDRDLFDRHLGLTKEKLMGPYGLFYWKVSPDGQEKTSASVDDLRIANAAAMAYRNWSDPKYQDMAEKLSRSILQHEVQDGVLVDFLNWREKGPPMPARTVQLSYMDTLAMDTLVQYDSEWSKVLKRSGELLLGGQRESGLFYEQYNLDTGKYEGEEQNVINQLYCALFAFFIDPKNDRFTVWLKKRFEEDGKIYAQYNSKTGEPMLWFESTSVYALAARYAYATGEKKLAGALLAKMLSFQNINRWSPMYGGFYDDEVFSFDNLEALITLRLFNNAG